jgi:hypothetical protein
MLSFDQRRVALSPLCRTACAERILRFPQLYCSPEFIDVRPTAPAV